MTLIKSPSYNANALPKRVRFFSLYLILLTLSLTIIGCGKKVDEEKPHIDRQTEPQLSELEQLLSKQELFCASDKACPEWISKIAIRTKNSLKFCTGFLNETNEVVTAASCLPEAIRHAGADCSSDIYFFFSEPGARPVRVSCDRVKLASSLEGRDPLMWKSNVAYLTLKTEMNRKTVSFPKTRSGLTHMDRFYTWTVDQIDDHQGIIRRTENCQAVQETFFNPLSDKDSSAVTTFLGCSFNSGNSGAPILDYRGKVRAITSKPVDSAELEEIISLRILERPLKSILHASNFACIPMLDNLEVLDQDECHKELTTEKHDQLQKSMMNESKIFEKYLSKLEHQINEENRYIKFRVILDADSSFYSVRFAPRCFKDVDSWIGEFSNNKAFTFYLETPRLRIRKAMSEYGRIFTQEIKSGEVNMSVQFRPKVLKGNNPRRANVYTRNRYEAMTYHSINEDCSQLLLF